MDIDNAIPTRALLDVLEITDRRERRNFASQLYQWVGGAWHAPIPSPTGKPPTSKLSYGVDFVRIGDRILWLPDGVDHVRELYMRKINSRAAKLFRQSTCKQIKKQ